MLREGRKQSRTHDRFLAQILSVCDPRLTELAAVENVSSHGSRLVTERLWEPGAHVILCSSTGNVWARARVAYCQSVGVGAFAVGLNFLTQTSEWEARSGHSASKQPKQGTSL